MYESVNGSYLKDNKVMIDDDVNISPLLNILLKVWYFHLILRHF